VVPFHVRKMLHAAKLFFRIGIKIVKNLNRFISVVTVWLSLLTRRSRLNMWRGFIIQYIKDLVYVPPLPRSLVELRERIAAAVMTIDRMMLQNVWNELDYRLDVCHVTQGAHIEHL
jgi:hypothetical protein